MIFLTNSAFCFTTPQLDYKNFFMIFFLIFSTKGALAQQAMCYDITNRAHQCPQKETASNENRTTYNTDGTQKASLRRVTIEALSLCPLSQSQTASNIIDIQKVIESAQLTDRENFICKQFVEISKQNAKVEAERKFMLEYINKQKSKLPISPEDQIKMTSLLIKYRLMENKQDLCSHYKLRDGTCYFSTTRFSAPEEMQKKIQSVATNYVEQFGGPKGCFINRKTKTLAVCEEEIKLRVRAIPAPLVLAQITQESGWGKSDWAKGYNNFLGLQVPFRDPETMACYKNCRCAGEGQDRCALLFKNMTGCLYEYYGRFNASSSKGYSEFRKARLALSNQEGINTSFQKAKELIPYLGMYAEDPSYQAHICNTLNQKTLNDMIKKCPPFKIQLY